MAIDIHSRKSGLAGDLSNLKERFFFFDEVPCASLEGPIQALKYSDPTTQRRICMLSGREAQKKGQEMNETWKSQQVLWWKGRKYPRNSTDYQKLLDELYASAFDSVIFQKSLLDTGDAELIHTISKDDPTDTVLTVYEFCSRLTKERDRLRRANGILTAEEINDAAKKMELDGIGAFTAVKEMYGEQVAKLLLAAHIRQGERKAQGRCPKEVLEKILDELVVQQLKEI